MTTIRDVFSKKTASEVYRMILLSPGSYLFDEVDLEEKETHDLTLYLTNWYDSTYSVHVHYSPGQSIWSV